MDPIRLPEILRPDQHGQTSEGASADVFERVELLEKELREVGAYGRRLWRQLDTVRRYLTDSLPTDPRDTGTAVRVSASPSGPDDDLGWAAWTSVYAGTVATLVGPDGDSGYGASAAQREATQRRVSPVMRVHARHPGLSKPVGAIGRPALPAGLERSGGGSDRSGSSTANSPDGRKRSKVSKAAAGAVLVLLAIRGLRRRDT